MPPYSMPLTSTSFFKKRPPLFYNKKDQKKRNSYSEPCSTSIRQAPSSPSFLVFCLKISFPVTGFSQGPESHGALNTSTCASHPVQSAAPEVKADGHGDGGRFGLWAMVGSVSSERLTNRMRFPNRIMPCPPWGHPNINSHSNNGKMSELWVGNEYHLYMYIYIMYITFSR